MYMVLTGTLLSRCRHCKYFSSIPHPSTDSHNSIETVSSMSSLFLALVLSPRVQKRAQAELDVVVGRDRLPTFDDRPRLPYIEAICRELLRWWMITPMGSIIPYQLPTSGHEKSHLQEFSMRQVRMMFTRDSLFRKVRFILVVVSFLP
jgi:hypothetical protein